MTFFVEHPYLSYLLFSALLAAYVHVRLTPEQLRIKSKNYAKAADKMEEFHKTLPPLPYLLGFLHFIFGFTWPWAFAVGVFGKLKEMLFGVEEIDFDKIEREIKDNLD